MTLPCIVCNKALTNIFPNPVNQPGDGLCFISYGAYGSTAFDPMDGSAIEVNICDECLTAAAEQQRVFWQQHEVHILCQNIFVGAQKVDSHEVFWDPNFYTASEVIHVKIKEIGAEVPGRRWIPHWKSVKKQFRAAKKTAHGTQD